MSSALPWLQTAPPDLAPRAPRRRRLTRRARAVLAAVLAGVVVALIARAAMPAPPPHEVVVAARDVAAGHLLTGDDVTVARVGDDLLPEGAVTDLTGALGKRVSTAITAREILTGAALVVSRDLADDERALHVPVADPGAIRLLRPGDLVDLVALDTGHTVASVRVLSVDDPSDDAAGHGIVVAVPVAAVAALVPATGAGGVAPALRNRG
ncbi:MAG: SAF domain-containing protein [Mobilicoccus sp.]|nr:SAF domain-containing protein [Mobilicoccus sp.]